MRRLGRRAALAVVLVLLACSSGPTGPQPGTLSVKLQSPNSGADGAILFTLSGPTPLSNVQAAPSDTLWTTDFSTNTSHVLLTGTIASGVILKFDVPDVNQYAQYLVTVNQAASGSDYSLRPLTNYVGFVQR